MAPRPHWKGFLKLSLVSCPIALYPAISAAERISFRNVNKTTGNRLRQQLVDSVTGEVVQSHDKGRGYQVGEREFLLVKDEELAAAHQEARTRPFAASPAPATPPPREEPSRTEELPRPRGRMKQAVEVEEIEEEEQAPAPSPRPIIENTRTIEIDRFFPRDQLDPRYFDTPYFITPRDHVGLEAYAVIRDAMRAKDVVGMGRVVLSKRERPIIVQAMGDGLTGMTLRYSHEVRSAADYFDDIPELVLPADMLRVAEHIVDVKLADFDPAHLEDRYRTVLIEKLRERHAELPRREAPAVPSRENVVSLMDALKRSLAAEKPAARPTPRRAAAQKRSASSGRKSK
jgi:Ku protein